MFNEGFDENRNNLNDKIEPNNKCAKIYIDNW